MLRFAQHDNSALICKEGFSLDKPCQFLLWGWIVQLTMGLAFWILPRYWQSPAA